ncbi:M15 family metallopeptidase [Paenibacillus sp. N4]|uniref:M15 family metallopeptidase n=1 Tax=Paenibacillus vietnamensis TaxID=2590547 RepID=UPI001CD08565|nr:M15 family metallopeptidase [Paenibacillus vietnamensis]MCA0756155.1 M15 family metallopeptidase [Paenibacillus vietnamensis]
MTKRKTRLLLFVIVCAALVLGYNLLQAKEFAWLPPKQSGAGLEAAGGGEAQGGTASGEADSSDGDETVGSGQGEAGASASPSPDTGDSKGESPGSAGGGQAGQAEDGMAVVAQPESISVLVNKQNKLPEDYNPSDLVYPEVPFIFSEKAEKRMMRKEAAEALERMFAGAEKDGVALAGVSAYRSHSTQKTLFERYVKRDGLEKARTYSAYPGTSEHETGLAIDVTGGDGKCAADDCFAGTPEALWLAGHAHEYGFIIRYLKGKEEITGYQYEPWHLRYVGGDVAAEMAASGESLEEYYNAVPVTN